MLNWIYLKIAIMLKFNIIIPCRRRLKYLRTCLHYLNKYNMENDISVYLCWDDLNKIENYDNLKIINLYFKNDTSHFCRARLLNYGLSKMRENFDFVSIIDNDMIYSSKFFNTIKVKAKNNVYLISGGNKLTEKSSIKAISELPDFDCLKEFKLEPDSKKNDRKRLYPSQISMNKHTYLKILDMLQSDKLYDDRFVGWGGEDSHLSFILKESSKRKLIKKDYVRGMWYHLYHVNAQDRIRFDKEQYMKNKELLHILVATGRKKVNEYITGIQN